MTTVKSNIAAEGFARHQKFEPTGSISATDTQKAIEQAVAISAPIDAEYLLGAVSATLTAGRVVTDTSTITWDLATAGQAKANLIALGTPASGDLSNCINLPVATGISGLATGIATFLATPSSANLAAAVTDETGSGALVFGTGPTIDSAVQIGINATADATNKLSVNSSAILFNHNGTDVRVKLNKALVSDTASFLFQDGFSGRAEIGLVGSDDFQFKVSPDGTSFTTGISIAAATAIPTLNAPILGTPTSGTLTNCTGLPVSTGIAGLGTGIATFLATPSSANFASAVTDETGSGALVFGTSPGFTTAANPASDDGATLGTAALQWSDLFLADGGTISTGAGTFVLTFDATNKRASLTSNAGNPGFELGRIDGVSSTPYIDFHSGATAVDFDVRFIASGGTGVTGGGALTITANAGVSLGTSTALTTGTIELGAASDTTISRSAAGIIAVESVPLYSQIPQNSQSAAYTLVLADAQKHILHPTADNNARTFTIPANSSVAYPIGTAITFVNQINTVTIAITTDTLTLAGTGTTGSRTLAANGIATALKIANTSWIISGTGLT